MTEFGAMTLSGSGNLSVAMESVLSKRGVVEMEKLEWN